MSVPIFVERNEHLATTSALIASTLQSRLLPAPWALPDKAARAASMASTGSDLPVRRQDWQFGRSTSTTSTPVFRKNLEKPAP